MTNELDSEVHKPLLDPNDDIEVIGSVPEDAQYAAPTAVHVIGTMSKTGDSASPNAAPPSSLTAVLSEPMIEVEAPFALSEGYMLVVELDGTPYTCRVVRFNLIY